MYEPTHASFFSGVGGLDLGLERAGWRTVSFSEIDPYASAVLAERWPGVPNLGDITGLAAGVAADESGGGPTNRIGDRILRRPITHNQSGAAGSIHWQSATLWSGGFPCQDLSVAGKRAGFGGERSSLAFAFLDLVERHRPPAILLENVPGLLSSHRGRDFGTLLDRLAQLGYGWAYRILDARHFGVPQRRRRVFIVALDTKRGLGAERAAAVLSVGTRCERHLASGVEAGEGAAERVGDGTDIVGQAISAKWSKQAGGPAGDEHHKLTVAHGLRASDGHHGYSSPRGDGGDNLIREAPDPGGVRAPDGLAGRLDDLAPTLRVGPQRPQDGGPGDTVPIISALRASTGGPDDNRAQAGQLVSVPVAEARHERDGADRHQPAARGEGDDGGLLPLGLDSHRYRCCGNGVVSNVAEWIGLRLLGALA